MNAQYLKIAFFYGSLGGIILLLSYMIIISVSPNTITLNYNVPLKSEMNALAPQGWAFFTKDVHTDYFKIYKIQNNKLYPVEIKSADASQFFGLRRDNRFINFKIQTIIDNIEPTLWYPFKGDANKINMNSLSKVSISVKEPMVYGTFLIEKGAPLPYEWYRSDLKIKKTMSYIQLELKN